MSSWFDNAIWVAGIAGHVTLLAVLVKRRLYRLFPVFTAYVLLEILTEPMLFLSKGSTSGYFITYYALQIPEAVLEIAVLLEIAASVVRPVRRSLPSGILWLLGGLMFCGAVLGLTTAIYAPPHTLSLLAASFFRVTFGIAVLRLLIFAAIAGFASLLGIGWKNYVLQLATGWALYGTVSIVVELYFVRFGTTPEYDLLARLETATYVVTQAYWIWSFARQEAARKEFSPQMAKLLLSLTGNVRATREALRSQGGPQ